MRRNAIVVTLVLAALCGCQKPAAEMETEDQQTYAPAAEPDLFMVDPAAESVVDAEALAYEGSARDFPVMEDSVAGAPASRSHRVNKGDTLYALARRYYSDDQRRWKDIYEANRDQLSSPNSLRVGQVLRIP